MADLLFECVTVVAPENFVLLGGQVGLDEGEFPTDGAFVEEHDNDLDEQRKTIKRVWIGKYAKD